MRDQKQISINSIYGGISPTLNFSQEGSYLGAKAIDPDVEITSRIAGTISPVVYQKFTSAVSGVNWFEPNDKDTNTYYYTKDGDFGYMNVTGGITEVTALVSAAGNGLKYYNNYYYIATDNNIYRYGAMDATSQSLDRTWADLKYSVTRLTTPRDNSPAPGMLSAYHWGDPNNAYEYDGTYASASQGDDKYHIWKDFRYYKSAFEFTSLSACIPDTATAVGIEVRLLGAKYAGGPAGMTPPKIIVQAYEGVSAFGTRSTDRLTTTPATYVLGGTRDTWARTWAKSNFNANFGVRIKGSTGSTPPTETQYFIDNVQVRVYYKTGDTLSNVALGKSEVATIGNYKLPNHNLLTHGDDFLYVLDGEKQGLIHKIKSYDYLPIKVIYSSIYGKFLTGETLTGEQSGATGLIMGYVDRYVEGTRERAILLTNVAGTFKDGEYINGTTDGEALVDGAIKRGYGQEVFREELKLEKDFIPTAIVSYGTDLIIAASNGEEAKLYFWDTFDNSFYREVKLPYPTVSALLNHNGDLYVFGGDEKFSIGKYIGGEAIQEIYHSDHGLLPLQGAVKTFHNKIMFGSRQTYPSTGGCIWAWGTKVNPTGLHAIASVSAQVSSLHQSGEDLIASSDGLYEKGSDGYNSTWRSQMFNFSQPFSIDKITIPFTGSLGAGATATTVKATLRYDNDRITDDEHTITLGSDSRMFTIYPKHQGTTNFCIELTWSGDTFVGVGLPIKIDYQLLD